MLQAYNSKPKKLRYLIKYENLKDDTFNELEKIYNFLEIEIDKGKLNEIIEKFSFENIPDDQKGKGKFNRSARPGLWKENFSDEEKKIMNEVMGVLLQKLGY